MGCRSFMSPCPGVAVSRLPPPRCVCGVVSVAVARCPWRGLRGCGVVSMSVVWWCVRGLVSVSVAWSPCQQHGLHGRSLVSVAVFSICCITLGLLASYLPMDVFTHENRPAEQILPHGSWHRYRLYRSHTCSKFLEVTPWARGVHVLDSFDSHSPTTLQRGHTLSCFSLSVYLRAVCPQGVHRADPWSTKG